METNQKKKNFKHCAALCAVFALILTLFSMLILESLQDPSLHLSTTNFYDTPHVTAPSMNVYTTHVDLSFQSKQEVQIKTNHISLTACHRVIVLVPFNSLTQHM